MVKYLSLVFIQFCVAIKVKTKHFTLNVIPNDAFKKMLQLRIRCKLGIISGLNLWMKYENPVSLYKDNLVLLLPFSFPQLLLLFLAYW